MTGFISGRTKSWITSLHAFAADTNSSSEQFQGFLKENDFIAVWKSHIQQYLSVNIGKYAFTDRTSKRVPSEASRGNGNKHKNNLSFIELATKLTRKQLFDFEDEK